MRRHFRPFDASLWESARLLYQSVKYESAREVAWEWWLALSNESEFSLCIHLTWAVALFHGTTKTKRGKLDCGCQSVVSVHSHSPLLVGEDEFKEIAPMTTCQSVS